MQILEERCCLSVTYDYSIIAKTGDTTTAGDSITSLSGNASINDSGRLAFTADLSGPNGTGQGVVIGDGPGGANSKPVKISFSSLTSRLYAFPQIANDNKVVVRDIAGDKFLIRTWDSNTPGLFTDVVTTNPIGDGFDSRFASVTLPTRANDGGVAFVGILKSSSQAGLYFNSGGTNSLLHTFPSGSGGFRPTAANGGRVVVRDGGTTASPIVLYQSGTAPVTIADSTNFQALGAGPGINADGRIVVFYGVLTSAGAARLNASQSTFNNLQAGPGVFASVHTATRGRVVVQIAAQAAVGEESKIGAIGTFDVDNRIAVNTIQTTPGDATPSALVVFTGTNAKTGNNAIFCNRLDFFGSADDAGGYRANTNTVIAAVGDSVTGLSGTIQSLSVWAPLNNVGQVVFNVNTTSGGSAVIKAQPKPKNIVVDADGHPLNGVKIDVMRGSSTLTTVWSDYDGNSTTLDADGITGDFDLAGIATPAPGQMTSVVVSAKDLNGKTYTRTINVQASQISAGKISLGTVKLDGLNTPVGTATSTSTGGAYRTVDANGVISLHDDQRNNDADHVIKRREPSNKLVVSARYKAAVTAVTTKLAGLGFRENNGTDPGSNAPPLTPTATWATTNSPTGIKMPAAERALLLFQTLWQKQGLSVVLKEAIEGGKKGQVSGQVAAKDLAHLNAAKGVIWDLNAGRSSVPVVPSYTNDFVYRSDNNNRWMHASAIRALADLDLVLDGLAGNLATSARTITSNSPATGGDRPGVGGITHHAGGEIDVPWVTTNGTAGTAGSGDFFRALMGARGVVKVPRGAGGSPLLAQEWTRAQRTAAINAEKPTVQKRNPQWTTAQVGKEAERLAEVKALAAGKRWTVVDAYDRERTKAFIQKIFALNATVPNRVRHLYFNDPALLPGGRSAIRPPAGVKFIPKSGHGNHIHFSINFDKNDSLPARGA